MTEPVVLPNPPQVGMNVRLLANGIDPIGSWLEVQTTIGRNDFFIMPALEQSTEDPHNIGQQNRPNNQTVDHMVDLRIAEVDLAVENGGDAAPYEQLQQMEQEDLQAVRNILPRWSIPNNVINVRHYWAVLKQLRDNLLEEGSHGMSFAHEYARILQRLARVITIPSKQEYESVHCAHHAFPLDFEGLVKVVEEMLPGFLCPLDYGEFLDRLLKDMTATYSVMRVEDGVYVIRDQEDYARRLLSLAAHVLRCV